MPLEENYQRSNWQPPFAGDLFHALSPQLLGKLPLWTLLIPQELLLLIPLQAGEPPPPQGNDYVSLDDIS